MLKPTDQKLMFRWVFSEGGNIFDAVSSNEAVFTGVYQKLQYTTLLWPLKVIENFYFVSNK